MKNAIVLLVFSSFFLACAFGQPVQKRFFHPFTGTLLLTAEGGATLPFADYTTPVIDFAGRGSLEYFFPFEAKSALGIRGTAGSSFIRGKDNARNPVEFRTGMFGMGGSVIYALSIGEYLFPYLGVGANYVWFSPKDGNGNAVNNVFTGAYKKTELQYQAELGFRIPLSRNLTLNLASVVGISKDDYLDGSKHGASQDIYYAAMGGVSFAFFAQSDSDGDYIPDDEDNCPETPEGIRVTNLGCPVDADKDGVPDYLDKCADTPAKAKVNKEGCPVDSDYDGVPDYADQCPNTSINIMVDKKGCPLDSDGDGVGDYADKCPGTPGGVTVDQNGCAKDSDGDSVPDYVDQCPNTPANYQVDATGCPLKKEQVIKEVPVVKEIPVIKEVTVYKDPVKNELLLSAEASFESSKAVLKPAALDLLDKFALQMKAEPKTKWVIEGHTDNTGKPKSNKQLSLDRATAVQKYLAAQGVKISQLTVVGYGSERPVATNATPDGRAQNRRVVIRKKE